MDGQFLGVESVIVVILESEKLVFAKKLVTVSFCQPQIRHGMP
jgi:hypothetical protein